MSLHGISEVSLLIIFLIAVLLFSPKYLRLMLKDLGVALKNCAKTLTNLVKKQSKPEKFDSEVN